MKTSVLQHNNNNSTLHSFLIASGIYAILFFGIFYSAKNFLPKDVGLQTRAIAISLSHFSPSTKEPLPTPKEEVTPKPTPIEKPKPIQKPLPKPKPIAKPIKQVESVQPTPIKPIENVENTKEMATEAKNALATPKQMGNVPETLTFGKVNDPFLISVKQAIDKNLEYPRKARMLRMTGIVMVEFTLLKEGGLENVKIIESSQHQLLDKSAIKTIMRATNDFPIPKNNVIIQIPIQYLLT